ncbi:aminotransferase class III-fold pyridoxal phosphate-dependent enzyme [Sphaerisporangium sp. TRM90804]|uniref:aminotransferase class III-fold pyridoxal phosphate-dependent enzyme n=1 Tax=Sphaerisporangium sp. TRM90804 TaxID=3031113 RepID=UPI00244BC9C0|nr:aminotransferase class III-fold pyridoxal phosphate-dependent enzyme [Sphaerisporangium sp. TRM90804]MDH2430673.1 aminotransferase class III-fold pyridoxal phosphate-dependent enzyme [Sphaerisporangium sp. TRM90804]
MSDSDASLRERAAKVVPGGMYGHLNAAIFGPGYPQFFLRGEGCRQWDADGREYVDLMCGWGPIILGHRHPAVERAVAAQQAAGDCLNGPGPVMVELAELMVDTIPSADWVMFSKNGTDATTQALMVARAATGRAKVLMAHGAYHGADPWCTPSPAGTTPNERADLIEFAYNDLASAEAAAAQAEGDVAAIIVTPFKHDSFEDQELADPEFARGVRALADRIGAALVIDDVRAGFRLDLRGSWEPFGVRPDLTAWSKALANGYAIAAVTGTDALRGPAQTLYSTGSFWFSAVPMAAAKATIETLRDIDGVSLMRRAGDRLRAGLDAQAASHGFTVRQTGPVQIPWLSFEADETLEKAMAWSAACLEEGVYLHPWHNWFLSAAHTDADVDRALQGTDAAFAKLRARFGAG